jgi:hypothetical protein
MLSYLTAPYVRVPLLMRFFADQTRLRALASPELREVLDACLFEPGLWSSPGVPRPATTIPAPDRRELATPCGLLFNELRCAPAALVGTLDAILENALELDTGRYAPTTAPIILYAIRTIVRVEGFCLFLLRKHGFRRHARPSDMAWLGETRGLGCDDARYRVSTYNMCISFEAWCAVGDTLDLRCCG